MADVQHLLAYALIAVSMLAATLACIMMRRSTSKARPVPDAPRPQPLANGSR